MRRYPEPKTGRHTGWSPGRDRAKQQALRDALIERSGGRCEYLEPLDPDEGYGHVFYMRCNSTDQLQAHHLQPGYTEDCGILVCRRHHRALDRHAR